MRERSTPALAALLVFCAALWLPLGQEAFLSEHWMKIGTFTAPMLLFMAFTMRPADSGPIHHDAKLMATLLTSAYMLHQFEEHWVDALGQVYPLRGYLNQMLGAAFGPEAANAMTPEAIFFINTSAVWLIGFLGIWSAPAHIFPALTMAGVCVVNGLSHVIAAAAVGAYNPGVLTSLLLFIPLSVLFFWSMSQSRRASPLAIAAATLWAILAHVVLFAGLLAANVHGLIPVSAYYATLILLAIIPLFLFRPAPAETS